MENSIAGVLRVVFVGNKINQRPNANKKPEMLV